ncbi:hypothetical protein HPB48_015259 [Haemaphysalis longicornis]|uniref:RING-type domain-containing protein n=1 Tax=Haemaphysalis longicornis TaxID=44386 RepID=A0A9J6FHQ9_HAELO|nr:hypothetical protein HPB48_015259 [Haemaphysalis longicornis]
MAHCKPEFVLVGYSEDLERRPLKFVDQIPPARICGACGNVPRRTYFLLCGHTLCKSCYQSCVTYSKCVCPLDGEDCAIKKVSVKEYPVENLLSRKVHCWNEANGCLFVLPASHIVEHVRHHCEHHVTRCPKCSAVVLSRDMCAHLKSRCTEHVLHTAPEAPQRTDENVNTQFVAFEREVKHRVIEVDAKLAQLSLESTSQSDKLVTVCHNLNHLKEALAKQFESASVQTLDRLDRNEADMKAMVAHEKTIEKRVGELDAKLAQLTLHSGSQSDKLIEICRNSIHLKEALAEQFGPALDRHVGELKAFYAEKIESLSTALTSVLPSAPRGAKTDQRVVTGYTALKEKALKKGWSRSWSC